MNIKINPSKITNTKRNRNQLEAFAVFAICVANKDANRTAERVNSMLAGTLNPFALLRGGKIEKILRRHRVGQYNRIGAAIEGIKKLDLFSCTKRDLVAVKGIGHKTANFFLLHSRKGYDGVVLDVHILRWAREVHNMATPRQTPSSESSYLRWEVMVKECIQESYPDSTLADADLHIWKKMSGN